MFSHILNLKIKIVHIVVLMVMLIAAFATTVLAKHVNDISDVDLDGLLDNIVYSASKHSETLEESPANVFIITREMMDNYGCQNIGEALSMAPGIYITDDYSLSQIGVRGVSNFGDWNMHVLVLVNGRPINEKYAGTSSIDVPGIDIENLKQIEVVKGPASTLYGTNAFFGIINLITDQPTENGMTLGSTYYTGTDSKSTNFRFFHRVNKDLSIFSTASYVDRNGNKLFFDEFSDFTDGSLWQLDAEGYNQYYVDSLAFTGGFAEDKNSLENFSSHNQIEWKNFYMTLHYGAMNTGVAHSMWGSIFNNEKNQFKERNHFADVGYIGSLSEKVNIDTRFSYNYYTWSDYVLYNYASWDVNPDYLPGPIWQDFEYNQSWSSEVRFHIDFNKDNKLILGGEAQFHNIRQESGETDVSGENILVHYLPEDVREYDGQIYNLYGQTENRLSDRVKFVGGLHYNYYSFTTGRVTPKGALIYNPFHKGTFKLIASQGFRSPSFYEVTYDDTQFYLSNSDLEPELITSYEAIYSHQLPYGISVDVAGNYSQITDLILQTVIDTTDPGHPGGSYLDEVVQFQNGGEMNTTSFEFGIKSQPVYRLSGFANVTYQKLSIKDNQQESTPFNSPRWLGNFGLNYQLIPQRLSVSTRIQYISARSLWDHSSLGANNLVDINFGFKKVYGLFNGSLGIKNLFDENLRAAMGYDFAPTTSIKRPGRSVFLNLSMSTSW